MILITGKYEPLADCIAEKFRTMQNGIEVQVRNSIRLIEYLYAHDKEIEMLLYVDKRQSETAAAPSRMEHLQSLWTAAAKHGIPLMLLFFKYNIDQNIDSQLEKYSTWIGKQFQKPPYHYLFKMSELYGLGDRMSVVDEFYREITTTGSLCISRWEDDNGEFSERQLDYLHVLDVTRVIYWFAVHRPASGVYEIGTGFPRTDTALAEAIFRTIKRPSRISYHLFPSEKASSAPPSQLTKRHNLRYIGYKKHFPTIETGVKSYIHRVILKE